MDYLEKMLAQELKTVRGKALAGEDVDGVKVLTDFERGKIESGRFTYEYVNKQMNLPKDKRRFGYGMGVSADGLNCLPWFENGVGIYATLDVIKLITSLTHVTEHETRASNFYIIAK